MSKPEYPMMNAPQFRSEITDAEDEPRGPAMSIEPIRVGDSASNFGLCFRHAPALGTPVGSCAEIVAALATQALSGLRPKQLNKAEQNKECSKRHARCD